MATKKSTTAKDHFDAKKEAPKDVATDATVRHDTAHDNTALRPGPIPVNDAIEDDEIDDYTGAAEDRDTAATALDAIGRVDLGPEEHEQRSATVEAIKKAQDAKTEMIHRDAENAAAFRDAAVEAKASVEAAKDAGDDSTPRTIDEAVAAWNALTPEQRAKRMTSGKQQVIEEGGKRFDAHTATYLD